MTESEIQFASAISSSPQAEEAAAQLADAVMPKMGGGPVDLMILCVTRPHVPHFETIYADLQKRISPAHSLALTAESILGDGRELERVAGASILVGRLPGAWIKPFSSDDFEQPKTQKDVHRLARLFMHEEQTPTGLLIFADPFSTPMMHWLPALNEALPGAPVIGGMASSGGSPGENRLGLDGKVVREGAVGLSMGGRVSIQCTVSQGCRPIGKPWIITKAQHNIIQELGGKPAIKVLQDTVSELPPHEQQLVKRGLFIGRVTNEYKPHFGRGDFLIRNIMGFDAATGYIAVNDLLRIGQTIQFHVRDHRTAEEDLRMLLDSQHLHGPASGVLLATCNGRGKRLFHKPDAESAIIRESLGPVPMAGFFAAGEIGPIGGQNHLHGFTASMAIFRQTPDSPAAPETPGIADVPETPEAPESPDQKPA